MVESPPEITNPELKPPTTVVPVRTAAELREFVNAPWKVHWGDPYFVPRLAAAEKRFLDPARNPFFARAERELFIAKHGEKRVVGTIAACIDRDHDAARGVRAGFFGFYDFLGDRRVPEALLRAAVAWLRERGAQDIYGPCQLTPMHECGLLVEGFEDDPAIHTAYNPPGYVGHVERLGLEPWLDLHAYKVEPGPPPERLRRAAERAARRYGATVRRVEGRRAIAREDALALARLQRETWAASPLGRPVRDEEALGLADALRHAIDPDLLLVLEARGEPLGYAIALRDMSPVMKAMNGRVFPVGWLKLRFGKHAVDRARVVSVVARDAARRPGLAAPLVLALWEALVAKRYGRVEISTVPAGDRRTRAFLARVGARRTKVWRLYRVPPTWEGPTSP